MHTLAANRTPAPTLTITGPTLFSEGVSVTTCKHPVLPPRASFQLKRSSSSLENSIGPIDLDSPVQSPENKKSRRVDEVEAVHAISPSQPLADLPALSSNIDRATDDEHPFGHGGGLDEP